MLDENVQSKILQFLYDKWMEDFFHLTGLAHVFFEGITDEAVISNAEYLASKGLIEEARTAAFDTKITVYGIDQVEDARISTDVQKRIRILQILKEHFEKDPYGLVSRETLVRLTDFTKEEIMRNVWYLGEKGLARVDWAHGGYFGARITDIGIDELKRPSLLENEQRVMSYAYSFFYILENKLRIFIERKLTEAYGEGVWKMIPEDIRKYAERRKSKERDSNISLFHYMLFKHLSSVIGKNWNIFQRTFKNPTGIISRLNELEPIRRKIAHCRLLSNDELAKLSLFFKEIDHMIAHED